MLCGKNANTLVKFFNYLNRCDTMGGLGGYSQGRGENSEARGKREGRSPLRAKRRENFQGLDTNFRKNAAGLFYEAPRP